MRLVNNLLKIENNLLKDDKFCWQGKYFAKIKYAMLGVKMTVETSSSRKSKKNFGRAWLDQAMAYKVFKNPQFWHAPQKLGEGTFWVRTMFLSVFDHAESENKKKKTEIRIWCNLRWEQPYIANKIKACKCVHFT